MIVSRSLATHAGTSRWWTWTPPPPGCRLRAASATMASRAARLSPAIPAFSGRGNRGFVAPSTVSSDGIVGCALARVPGDVVAARVDVQPEPAEEDPRPAIVAD